MNLYDETFFDHLTPLNVVTGAVARYHGTDLANMILLAVVMEVAENGLAYYLKDYFPALERKNPPVNIVVGTLASVTGWWLADLAINDMNRERA